MSESLEPVPQRISDADRDQAAAYLREALAEGRLDNEEFDERLGKALTAKTSDELVPLFRDLPGPKPGSGSRPSDSSAGSGKRIPGPEQAHEVAVPAGSAVPAAGGGNRSLTVLASVAWPAVIMLCFATHWRFWWLMFLPIMLSAMLGNAHRDRDRRH